MSRVVSSVSIMRGAYHQSNPREEKRMKALLLWALHE